ncbi:MAG: peptidoglycan DD-metalloendopeptidase family protein [Gemmatimonadota bacterium]
MSGSQTGRTWRRRGIAVMGLAGVTLLAGCGGTPGLTSPDPSVPPPPAPDPPPPTANTAPSFGSPIILADHNRDYEYVVQTTDAEGDAITLSAPTLPTWLEFDAGTSTIRGLADWPNVGSHSVSLLATDGELQTAQSFNINVQVGEIICDQDFGDPASSSYVLPYEVGTSRMVEQTYCPPNPTWGHHDWFAYDFRMPIGTTVTATRGGVVIFVRGTNRDGNRSPGDENFVFIEHADGTIMHYMHLTFNGPLVAVGDTVVQGQPIALSGDTGGSIGPHLHVALFRQRKFDREYTLPINFRNTTDALDSNRGLVMSTFYESLPFTPDP